MNDQSYVLKNIYSSIIHTVVLPYPWFQLSVVYHGPEADDPPLK